MKKYSQLTAEELKNEYECLLKKYNEYKAMGLKLDLSRGKPNSDQLDISLPLLSEARPREKSVSVVLVLTTLLYDAIGLWNGEQMLSLNFPTGVALLLLVAGEFMTLQRERITFDVVSARSRKLVVDRIPPRKKKVVRNGQIIKIIDDEAGERRFRVHATDQVAGYFRRSGEVTSRYRAVSALLLLGVFSSLLVGGVTLFVTTNVSQAMSALLLTMQIALPISSLMSYAYPLLLAARKLSQYGCAIVGNGAVEEYAGEKTLVFDDTEMFRSKSSTEISIKGSGDTKNTFAMPSGCSARWVERCMPSIHPIFPRSCMRKRSRS